MAWVEWECRMLGSEPGGIKIQLVTLSNLVGRAELDVTIALDVDAPCRRQVSF